MINSSIARTMTRQDRSAQYYRYAWVPVVLGLSVILGESTQSMGAAHTNTLLLRLVNHFHAQAATYHFWELNLFLRKTGHFFGYGILGVLFGRVWAGQINRRALLTWSSVRLRSAGLGIMSAFLIACCDEFHQSFLPGRTATFHDVLIDTSGALVLNAIVFGIAVSRRRHVVQYLLSLRARREDDFTEDSVGLAA
jgi:VanZ family protein